jgi:hypothetical protein
MFVSLGSIIGSGWLLVPSMRQELPDRFDHFRILAAYARATHSATRSSALRIQSLAEPLDIPITRTAIVGFAAGWARGYRHLHCTY